MTKNYMSGMLESMTAAMIAKKKKMEKGMQKIGARWAAHTAKVQKEIDSGKRRVDD